MGYCEFETFTVDWEHSSKNEFTIVDDFFSSFVGGYY